MMKFVHANFIRGNKQRCLVMRSIVKKASAQSRKASQQQQLPMTTLQHQIPIGGGNFLPFVQNTMGQFWPGINGGGASIPRPLYSQDTWPLSFPHSANQAVGGQNNMPNTMTRSFPSSLQFGMPNQFSHNAKMGMTSAELFEAGMQLERMEQFNQQQRQLQMMQPTSDQPQANAASMFNQQQSAPSVMRFHGGINYGSSNMDGQTDSANPDAIGTNPVVDLASRIMMNEPNLSMRQAIEMAMQIQNQNKQS